MSESDWCYKIWDSEHIVLSQLLADEVGFLVIGGTAACYHSAREVESVDDLDILLRPKQADADLFAAAIQTAAPSLNISFDTPSSFASLANPRTQFHLKNGALNIDFLTAESVDQFDVFLDSAIRTKFKDILVPVICKHHLIEMKEHLASQKDCDIKHTQDLQKLRQ